MPRQYNFGAEHKAKLATRKAVREKEREIEKLRKKLENKSYKLAKKKEVIGKIQQVEQQNPKDKKGTVVDTKEYDSLPSNIKQLIEEDEAKIVFKPNTGPQTDFLAAGEQDVLYGGSAGGGKSYAMLVDPLRYMHIKEHRALLLRKSMPELIYIEQHTR